MLDGQFNEKEQQAAGDVGSTRELHEAARVAQQEYIPTGCSKSSSSKAAADEGTGGVVLLPRPAQAAKTACSPSGLR